ncbi:unnamed protein product [Paramecium sonneborni]|uniref:Uncharacterized protein n=1 Tax=Paramecium sonneborni TaxID=65129 RepID=A0A8S1RTD0_9CILI|nr:unnamed protein product [Paramecium sonneborni]
MKKYNNWNQMNKQNNKKKLTKKKQKYYNQKTREKCGMLKIFSMEGEYHDVKENLYKFRCSYMGGIYEIEKPI